MQGYHLASMHHRRYPIDRIAQSKGCEEKVDARSSWSLNLLHTSQTLFPPSRVVTLALLLTSHSWALLSSPLLTPHTSQRTASLKPVETLAQTTKHIVQIRTAPLAPLRGLCYGRCRSDNLSFFFQRYAIHVWFSSQSLLSLIAYLTHILQDILLIPQNVHPSLPKPHNFQILLVVDYHSTHLDNNGRALRKLWLDMRPYTLTSMQPLLQTAIHARPSQTHSTLSLLFEILRSVRYSASTSFLPCATLMSRYQHQQEAIRMLTQRSDRQVRD